MTINFEISQSRIDQTLSWFSKRPITLWLVVFASILAVLATEYSFFNHLVISYGDAESHLNIAKRVVSGLTPGLAQLGGIWLPLPHILMVPFVIFDPLWRTGLAGSIVSGIAFVVSAVYVYKLTFLLTKNKLAGVVAFIVFCLNPNVLYLQSTPMTELTLIAFLLLSTYYFISYLFNGDMVPLMLAGIFGLAASLSRYDGWFLVLIEAGLIFLNRFPARKFFDNIRGRGATLLTFMTERGEGETFLFITVAMAGILAWVLWSTLILGDPFYFTNSQFSAKSQQQGFSIRGELPGYHNLAQSILYYSVTLMNSAGVIVLLIGIVGSILFLKDKTLPKRWLVYLLLISPFIFNVLTLFLGQSIIFIPHITPVGFQWRLFNVRYGILMIPALAIILGYLFNHAKNFGKLILISLVTINLSLYLIGYSQVMSVSDGLVGLSQANHPEAELWLAEHYDHGLVLIDDFARTVSTIGSGVPMENVVYVGSHLYWEEALLAPQRRIRWIAMKKDDAVWKALYANPKMKKKLYRYFNEVHSSNGVLIFERKST